MNGSLSSFLESQLVQNKKIYFQNWENILKEMNFS